MGRVIEGGGGGGVLRKNVCPMSNAITGRSWQVTFLNIFKAKRTALEGRKGVYCSLVVEHVWNVMAHAQKPDLVFQRNGRVHLNWRGASVQSTTGSRGVRISGSNAGYTMFWGRVQDYWLPTPLACFPFISPTVRHRVPSHFSWALPLSIILT